MYIEDDSTLHIISDLFSPGRRNSDGSMLDGTHSPHFGKGNSVWVRLTQSTGPGVAAHVGGGRVKGWKIHEILFKIRIQLPNNAS